MCISKIAIKFCEVKVDVQKGGLMFKEFFFTIMVLVHPLHIFIHTFHMVIALNDYHMSSCWDLHLGFRFLQTRGPWSSHGLPLVFVSKLSLSYCALIFVCLIQSIELHAMNEFHSMIFSLESGSGFHM